MSLVWTTGKNNESLLENWKQLRPRFFKRSLYGQLGTITEKNNYGQRPAAAFLLNSWELRPRSGRHLEMVQGQLGLRPRSGRLLMGQTETTTAAKRPPS